MTRTYTPLERIDAASVELGQINELLEKLWGERHRLYEAFRAIRVVQRNLDAVRVELSDGGEP